MIDEEESPVETYSIRTGYASQMNYGDDGWIVSKTHEDGTEDDLAFVQTRTLAELLTGKLPAHIEQLLERVRSQLRDLDDGYRTHELGLSVSDSIAQLDNLIGPSTETGP